MLPNHVRHTVALGAGLLLTGVLVAPAASAAPAPSSRLVALAATPSGSYTGFSDGTVLYANALNLQPVDAAKSSIGQSAAGVTLPSGALVTQDQLKQPLLIKSTSGKTAYGHGAGVSAGVLGKVTDPPQVAETTAEATSPAPSTSSTVLLNLPADPLATANVLPSHAAANTTVDGSCVIGKDISNGDAHVANATALSATPTTPVVKLSATSDSASRTLLAQPTTKTGTAVNTGKSGLLSQTTQMLAPITLFAGTPAELTIKLLAPLQLSAAAGGVGGTAVVSYGVVGAKDADPILSITSGGQTQTLTSQQLFGNGGVVLPLGVADVTIGAPAHSLTGLEGTPVTESADGTLASGAVDFVRISVPGKLATPGGATPVGGPLGPVLNPVLTPVLSGLDPILKGLQDALKAAGLDVADVRLGHLEASSLVPLGGITCRNPLDESRKDVSALNVVPGQTFTYDIRVPNRGSAPITNVVVNDTYAAGLEFVSSVPAPTSMGSNTLRYDLGTIQPNDFVTIVLTFRVPLNAAPGTVYHNEAVITGTYGGLPISTTVAVNGPTVGAAGTGPCDLSHSTKFASNLQVTTGENFGYFVNVLNSGGTACTNVKVTDRLIDGVTFVSCTSGCTHNGQDVTWNLGTLQPGQSRVLSVLVKTTATSGTLPNTAQATASNGTPGSPSTPGPTVTGTSVPAPGNPAAGTSAAAATAGPGKLPRTGLSTGGGALAVVLLLGAGGGLILRRRTAA